MTSKPGRYGIEGSFATSWLKPGYWKTLARLRPANPEVEFNGSALHFTRYPFAPASIFPSGAVQAEQIAEVNVGNPSQVRLKSGDILFVPWAGKAALLTFINQQSVRTERRSSVWSALLDPFLDTWEEQPVIDRQFATLARLGLDRDTVDRWRREVATPMIAYNFGTRLWEWGSLDLFDLMIAQRAHLSRAAFADFYARAIHLAALDPVSPRPNPSPHRLADALFSVVLDWYPREEGKALKDFGKRWDLRMEQVKRLQQKITSDLTAAYCEPHRRYHTVAHVEACLGELLTAWNYAVHLDEVRWALLFHDAIYDPQREDNEARSAEWACRVMDDLKRPADEKERVRAMILATRHAGVARTPDEALLLDIDLSILAADEAAFDEYDRAIRVEYSWVPEPVYRQERAKVLESFLRRERVYQTAAYRDREPAARRNLERALARLRQ